MMNTKEGSQAAMKTQGNKQKKENDNRKHEKKNDD